MKHLPKILGIVFVLLCLTSAFLWGFATLKSKSLQREARQSLEQVVANELPTLDGFDTIEVASFDSSDTVYGGTCYYAGDFLILGGSLAEAKALDRYAAKLESSGWIPRERQYPTSKVFMYRDHVQMNVRTGDLDPGLRDYVDYVQLRKTYPSIIFLRISFMLPNREDC